MQTSLRSHAKDQRSALWALASIGHEQHFFFLEKPYGTARPRKYYFRFILLLLKNYFTSLSIFSFKFDLKYLDNNFFSFKV